MQICFLVPMCWDQWSTTMANEKQKLAIFTKKKKKQQLPMIIPLQKEAKKVSFLGLPHSVATDEEVGTPPQTSIFCTVGPSRHAARVVFRKTKRRLFWNVHNTLCRRPWNGGTYEETNGKIILCNKCKGIGSNVEVYTRCRWTTF